MATIIAEDSTKVKENEEGEQKKKGKIESKTQEVAEKVGETLVDGSTKDSGSSDGGEKMSGNDKNVEDNKTDKSSKVSDSEGDKNKKNIKPDSGTSEKGSLEKEKTMVETKKTENDEFKAMMKQFQEQNQARTKEKQELLQKLKEANAKIDTLTKEQEINTKNVGAEAIKVNSGTNNQDPANNMQASLKIVREQQKKEKGFFGKIGGGIKSAFSRIGNGIKKGVNGVGSGIGKVTNRFVQKCQNNAAPSAYTDRRKYPDEILRKFPTCVVRKAILEPLMLPIAGIGSILAGDGSYFKNAWKRLRGRDDKSEALKEMKDDKQQAQTEETAVKSKEEKKEEKEEKSAIPSVQTKTAANTSSLTAEKKSETTTKSSSTEPIPTVKIKEPTEKITINKDDKFYCENGNAYYNVKKTEGDNITYIYYQDGKATEANVTNKDNFLKMITEKKCYQKEYLNAA